MPVIKITTEIKAPIRICFDLSRSIDLHMITTKKTKEKAISGKTTGLVVTGDTVTWEATHLGVRQKLSSRIIIVTPYTHFADEQIQGAFKRFHHDHIFKEKNGITYVTDIFDYTAPYGLLGILADKIFLTRYMKGFLVERNAIIKEFSESEKWKELPGMEGN